MHDRIGAVASTTLAGRPLRLPDDLDGPTLLLFAYLQRQQPQVDRWLAIAGEFSRLRVLELPVIGRRWLPLKPMADAGMSSNMDQRTREQTMCVYTDPRRFRRRVLGVGGGDRRVSAVLVDGDGRVLFHAAGAPHPATATALREAIGLALGPGSAAEGDG